MFKEYQLLISAIILSMAIVFGCNNIATEIGLCKSEIAKIPSYILKMGVEISESLQQ